ncbi:hypothetical protein, partial [Christensenella intestinihominis]|uniref:hypothetical protein n=1 Tax=Christensenella intestinihominis TaxID=1851429 RepID=UPI001A9A4FEF
ALFNPPMLHHVGTKLALFRFSLQEKLHPHACSSFSPHDPLCWARAGPPFGLHLFCINDTQQYNPNPIPIGEGIGFLFYF